MNEGAGQLPIRNLSDKWFQILLVTVILTITLIAHHFLHVGGMILHFFYLPVIIAAHYCGRTVACATATFAVLAVVIFTLLDPTRYMHRVDSSLVLTLSLSIWAGFLGVNALLVGTLSDQRATHIRDLRQAHMGIIAILSKYLQAADQYTKSHSQRVADLSEAIADQMGLRQSVIEDIKVGALLHDIGKVEISTRLIQKAAGLSETEKSEVDSHTFRGAELVRSLGSVLDAAIPIILHHHDHFSAESKAEGLHGEEIPLGARVIAVADAYDAIVTDRPYRRGRTPDEAVAIIRQESGRQFDPAVVRAFERVMVNRVNEVDLGEPNAGAPKEMPVEA